jgi:dGTPase
MFALGDIADLPLIGDILRDVDAQHPRIEPARRAHELVRRLITRMIEDVIAESRRRLAAAAPASVEAVRTAGRPMVAFSPAMAAADRAIKDVLRPRLYRHPRIMRIMGDAEAVVAGLFRHFSAHPDDMPKEWTAGCDGGDAAARALRVADFIAGMTDRFAMVEHARLVGSTPDLR